MTGWGRWRIGLLLIVLATALRLGWTLAVPTIPVGDFATYRESAIYLAEFGHLDPGFVYMPGLVLLLAGLHAWGGDVLAAKLLGVAFGGLAVGPVYWIAARLTDDEQPLSSAAQPAAAPTPRARGRWNLVRARQLPCHPAALTAGLAYALWPAGIAISSVMGTDIPTAALILLALACLCAWGETRPLLATVAFGAMMGVAAYFRAVALPLTILSVGYWLAIRAGARATLARTALAVGTTILLLLPWGLRNLRQSGEFYLTDSHGGITALMGNDPNTEGTYSRSLGLTFRQLTGRTFLMEPHRVTDRVAYKLAKEWIAFDPAWTVGMIALRTERLFAPERGLLYWPVYRRGVVPPETADWFNRHRAEVTGLADLFYLVLIAGMTAGAAFAVVERRWKVLVPVPFALALAGTYALFVAEPRYRLTTEVLLFPLFGFGAARLVAGVRSLVGDAARASPARPDATAPTVLRTGLLATGAACCVLVLLGFAVVRGGAGLRDRHRWAATVWQVDGRPQLAQWRRGPGAPGGGSSPVRGASPGTVLRLTPEHRQADAEVILPDYAPAPGMITIAATLAWPAPVPGHQAAFSFGGVTTGVGVGRMTGVITHSGGPLRVAARLFRTGEAPLTTPVEALITDVVLSTAGPGGTQSP